MNNVFKKIFIVTIIGSILVSFNYYTNSSQNLDDQSYVMAIGIDVGTTSKYKICMQLSTLETSATESAPSNEQNR